MLEYKIFGCKTNKNSAEKWMESEQLADKNGIFIASCIVTNTANNKWLKLVTKSLPLLQANEKIYLSGCASIRGGKVDERFFEKYPSLLPFQHKIELLAEDPESELDVKIRLQKAIERSKHIA